MKNQDFEESVTSANPTDIQVFCLCETVLLSLRRHQHDRDSSNPTSVPESLHTSLASQAGETLPRCSFELYETLILIETVVCVVWYKDHTTLGFFSRRSSFNVSVPAFVVRSKPFQSRPQQNRLDHDESPSSKDRPLHHQDSQPTK